MSPRKLKIISSLLFIVLISFFVVKNCIHKRSTEVLPMTHELPGPVIAPKQVTVGPRGQMAIILDDWKYNLALTDLAVSLHRPITLSILPPDKNSRGKGKSYSREIASKAHAKGLGVMLHMPMEPKNYKPGDLEADTIMLKTPNAKIVEYLDSALASVPFVEGVNNHMGSAATCDERVMSTVLKYLKNRNLFFVDSYTIKNTVCEPIAKQLGLRFARRNVFIDNELKRDAIMAELEKAKKIALTRGSVVVIGHDYKVTLKTIQEAIPQFEKEGIQFVLVKDLVTT